MKFFKGQVTIATLLTIVGGVAITIAFGFQYVNSAIQPVAEQSQQNAQQLAVLTVQVNDIQSKVDAMYDKIFNLPSSVDPK